MQEVLAVALFALVLAFIAFELSHRTVVALLGAAVLISELGGSKPSGQPRHQIRLPILSAELREGGEAETIGPAGGRHGHGGGVPGLR